MVNSLSIRGAAFNGNVPDFLLQIQKRKKRNSKRMFFMLCLRNLFFFLAGATELLHCIKIQGARIFLTHELFSERKI